MSREVQALGSNTLAEGRGEQTMTQIACSSCFADAAGARLNAKEGGGGGHVLMTKRPGKSQKVATLT